MVRFETIKIFQSEIIEEEKCEELVYAVAVPIDLSLKTVRLSVKNVFKEKETYYHNDAKVL